jgi:hypothetical protein
MLRSEAQRVSANDHRRHEAHLHRVEVTRQECRIIRQHVSIEQQDPVGAGMCNGGVARGRATPVSVSRDQAHG